MGSSHPIMVGGGPSDQSIYEIETSPRQDVGALGVLPDGRKYSYTMNTGAAALAAGKLLVRAALVAHHTGLDMTTTAMVAGAEVITGVTLGATAAAANIYQGGMAVITASTGYGVAYRIKSHATIASAGTGSFEIDGPITVSSGASTQLGLVKNAYRDPVIAVTDQLDHVVGVPNIEIPIGSTTAQYGWVQTWGECAVLIDETLAAPGTTLTTGTDEAGSVEAQDAALEPHLGYNVQIGVDTETDLIFLMVR